jgi:hypothetical protein
MTENPQVHSLKSVKTRLIYYMLLHPFSTIAGLSKYFRVLHLCREQLRTGTATGEAVSFQSYCLPAQIQNNEPRSPPSSNILHTFDVTAHGNDQNCYSKVKALE